MRTQSYILTVLPLTVTADAPFHVSLHVAPKLTPDAAEEPLKNFETFVEWARVASASRPILRNQAGVEIASEMIAQVVPELWSSCFPESTPVRRPNSGDYEGRKWASFDVKMVHDLAAATAVISSLYFPLDPPDFKTMPLLEGREGKLRRMIETLGGMPRLGEKEKSSGDEQLTRLLDRGPDNGHPLAAVLNPLHAARRFYEPIGAATRATDKDRRVEPIDLPEPDFHERVAHLADQPELLRRLGIVIDLKVRDLALLSKAKELMAELVMDAPVTAIASRTPVERRGTRLISRPRGSDWDGGRLRLGDENLFAALTMDSDGAALKLGNFIRALPRMLQMADNGDPGTVAPASLRSEGYTLVRTGRLDAVRSQVDRAGKMARDATPDRPPIIWTEDITRGFRVEIWDDHESRWFSPHRRLATATLPDGSAIYTDRRETGWVQTAALRETPTDPDKKLHLHEALFGWSGWSLSAPRPGPRAVPDGPKEKVETVKQEAAIGEVTVSTKVMPGTLPRLRYGRSYAFRAWGVDLAGNSHGGDIPQPTVAPLAPVAPIAAVVRNPRAFSLDLPGVSPLLQQIAPRATAVQTPISRLADFKLQPAQPMVANFTSAVEIDQIVSARMSARLANVVPIDTSATLTDQMRATIADVQLDTASAIPPAAFAFDKLDEIVGLPSDTVTPTIPFRRWDPVPPPVVVPRHRYSPAESVHHMVIRSGVDKDAAIETPEDYLNSVAAINPALATDWRAKSERHIAAPKGSQHLNELHGKFDTAINDTAMHRKMLSAALRDDGTLYDREIVSLDDPAVMVIQPGVTLEAGPEVENPVSDLSLFEGANRGDVIPAGHYVMHDVDRMVLPYLPDPLAAGVAMGMSGANIGSPLFGLFRTESTAARYEGDWPAPAPFRMVLETAKEPVARIVDGVITIGLPPGTRLDMRLSSSLRPEDLDLLALWMLFPKALRDLDLLKRPAADGQLWGLTPFERISLVHAVPRPILPPLITKLLPLRGENQTFAAFAGAIDCHASSTDRIDAEAKWSEWIDDIASPKPVREDRHAVAFTTQIDPFEDLVVLGETAGMTDEKPEDMIPFPGVGDVRVHRARHEFGDTKHRRVSYAFRGTTRFREYFPVGLLSTPDSQSLVGEATEISILNSAQPPVPEVESIIPLFRWDEEGDPGQPFGLRRRRRSGLRIYLKRPWYQTGEDEQLGVLLTSADPPDPESASLWGGDPVWLNAGPKNQIVGMALEDFYSASFGIDGERGNDDRISPASVHRLPGKGGSVVTVVGYRPEYNEDRGLWFVDVAIEPAAAVWPFVRLVVARFQPNSLPGKTLSKAVRCDFAQLLPERTLTVSRPDDKHIRVTVTGPIGMRDNGRGEGAINTQGSAGGAGTFPLGAFDPTTAISRDRHMVATVQRLPAGQTSDLDWENAHEQELTIGGVSADAQWAWTGVLPITTSIDPATPGKNDKWRVMITETEGIESDPDANGAPMKQWRTIYADCVAL
jgi:hypothetical protein